MVVFAVARESKTFSVISGLVSTASAYLNLGLMILFWTQHDVVWATLCTTFISMSVLYNVILCCVDFEGVKALFWIILSILQSKSWGDMLESLVHPSLQDIDPSQHSPEQLKEINGKLKEFRAKKFMTSVVQALPFSFMLGYVLMLRISERLNVPILFAAMVLSFLSFAIGTTLFAGANESHGKMVLVFLNVFAQFTFRVLVICAVCVRFRQYGLIGAALSWFIVYLFGPQGTAKNWAMAFGIFPLPPSSSVCSTIVGNIAKIFVTPLSFALVINAIYEHSPTPVDPNGDDRQVMAADCFNATPYLLFRLLENVAFAVCFVFVPREDDVVGNEHYQDWVGNTVAFSVVCGLCMLVILSTWFVIVNLRSKVQPFQRI